MRGTCVRIQVTTAQDNYHCSLRRFLGLLWRWSVAGRFAGVWGMLCHYSCDVHEADEWWEVGVKQVKLHWCSGEMSSVAGVIHHVSKNFCVVPYRWKVAPWWKTAALLIKPNQKRAIDFGHWAVFLSGEFNYISSVWNLLNLPGCVKTLLGGWSSTWVGHPNKVNLWEPLITDFNPAGSSMMMMGWNVAFVFSVGSCNPECPFLDLNSHHVLVRQRLVTAPLHEMKKTEMLSLLFVDEHPVTELT